ncbi:MAG: cellulase family glycosylhydrolase [Microbacteriaceae bacterium]
MTAHEVARRLTRGVNLSHWYGQVYMEPGYTPEHYASYNRDADLDLIARMGFDHVRFPLALERLIAADGPDLDDDFASRVRREVDRLQARGLTVVVDLHPENEFKDALAADDAAVDRFVATWVRVAERFADTDPASTVFEVLNEPSIGDAARWGDILRRSITAIRSRAPHHTILVSGDHYSEIPRLLELPELDDGNLVANFHLYDPVALSHQGAGWSPDWLQQTRGLDYPVDAENVATLRAAATDPSALAALDEYAVEGWDRDRYRRLVEPAAAWARERGLPLTCNEFGVYREFAPRAGRLRWLEDVTSVFEELGIGWTAWDYAGDFAVAIGERGHREPDVDVLAALGLGPSPRR